MTVTNEFTKTAISCNTVILQEKDKILRSEKEIVYTISPERTFYTNPRQRLGFNIISQTYAL